MGVCSKEYPFGEDFPVTSIWTKLVLNKPKVFKGFEEMPAMKTSEIKYSFQCSQRLSSDNTEWAAYDKNDKLISSDSVKLTKESFVSVIPDSMGDSMMRTACMKQFVNELTTIKLDEQSDANINRISKLYTEFPSQSEVFKKSLEEENKKGTQ